MKTELVALKTYKKNIVCLQLMKEISGFLNQNYGPVTSAAFSNWSKVRFKY